jgi:hypothetical protein
MRKWAHTLDVYGLVRSIDIDSEAGLQFIGVRMTWIVTSTHPRWSASDAAGKGEDPQARPRKVVNVLTCRI